MKKQTISKLNIKKSTIINMNAQGLRKIHGGFGPTKPTVPQSNKPNCETAISICGGCTQVQSLCSNLGICCA
jgi:hypothetical protein